jgi:hypothetical protein
MKRHMTLVAGLTLGLGLGSAAGAGDVGTFQGEVTDKAANSLTVKDDAGEEMTVTTDANTAVHGAAGQQNLADVDEGDRVRVTAATTGDEHVATVIEIQPAASGGGMDSSVEDPRQKMPEEHPLRPQEIPESERTE